MNDDLLSPVRLSSNAVLINATLPCEAQFERRTDQCIYLPGPAGSLMTGVRAYPWRPLVQWLLPVPALQRHNRKAGKPLVPGDNSHTYYIHTHAHTLALGVDHGDDLQDIMKTNQHNEDQPSYSLPRANNRSGSRSLATAGATATACACTTTAQPWCSSPARPTSASTRRPSLSWARRTRPRATRSAVRTPCWRPSPVAPQPHA